jgi:hypothetical protein
MRTITLKEFEKLPGRGAKSQSKYGAFVRQLSIDRAYVFKRSELPILLRDKTTTFMNSGLKNAVIQVFGKNFRLSIRTLTTGEIVFAIVKNEP